MSLTKLERDKQKLIHDKCQMILAELLRTEDNKYCVDCDSKGPRWASWNLGIFLCIRCAGIHRNLGVHISKVKSVNLDSWTPEQVGSIQNMGNSKARAVYEANLPDSFSRPQADSALESFIRAKYEQKKYIAKEWVETTPKPAFDVEAELKKEKEKKKSKIKTINPIGGVQTDIQSNPIPRPSASVNGKSEKVQTQPTVQKSENNSASTDLLGLDLTSSTNDETFGFFASAQPTTETETTTTAAIQPKSLDDEEKDFFSQKVPEQTEQKKLTKESILSLYSKSSNSNRINGFMTKHELQTNSINQFPVNQPFGTTNQTNVMNPSTNPFLASSGNSGFIPTDFQQANIIQGMSSLQMSSNPTSQLPVRGSNPTFTTAVPGNTQPHMNWFSNAGQVGATPSAMPSSVANPFVESSAQSSINMLNFNFKPSDSTNPSATNNLLNITTTPKENNVNLNNFW